MSLHCTDCVHIASVCCSRAKRRPKGLNVRRSQPWRSINSLHRRTDARLVALASLRLAHHFSPHYFVHADRTAALTSASTHITHHLHQYHTPWLRSRLPDNQKCVSIFGRQHHVPATAQLNLASPAHGG